MTTAAPLTTCEYVVVPLGELHPTQAALGHLEIYAKLGRHTLGRNIPPATLRRLRAPVKPAVRGPGGALHLIDGHHTLTALAELDSAGPAHHVCVRVVADLGDCDEPRFRRTIAANGWSHPRDAQGREVPDAALPTTLALDGFEDDALRSLLFFARGVGYESTGVPFQEFHWADWLRESGAVDLSDWDPTDHASCLRVIERLTRAQVALPRDRALIHGLTPRDLGALSHWNAGRKASAGEFGRLARRYEHPRPGKLAYALEFAQLRSMSSADSLRSADSLHNPESVYAGAPRR